MTGLPKTTSTATAPAAAPHEQAVAELVREHNRALHAFLMTRLRDEQEAREVAQEAYVRMLQLDRPGAIGFLRAYLFKTAANLAIDRVKQRAVRARLDEAVAIDEPIERRSPDRQVFGVEDLRVLKRALLELPENHRRAFLLYRIEEWSDARIAEELGVQPRMVRYYLSKAGLYCRLRVNGLSADEAKVALR